MKDLPEQQNNMLDIRFDGFVPISEIIILQIFLFISQNDKVSPIDLFFNFIFISICMYFTPAPSIYKTPNLDLPGSLKVLRPLNQIKMS